MNAEERLKSSLSENKLSEEARARILSSALASIAQTPIPYEASPERTARKKWSNRVKIGYVSLAICFLSATIVMLIMGNTGGIKKSQDMEALPGELIVQSMNNAQDHISDSFTEDKKSYADNNSAPHNNKADDQFYDEVVVTVIPNDVAPVDPVIPETTIAPACPQIRGADALPSEFYRELLRICPDNSHSYEILMFEDSGTVQTAFFRDLTTEEYYRFLFAPKIGVRMIEKYME